MKKVTLKIRSQAVPNLFSCQAVQILLAELIRFKKVIKAFETVTIASSVISLFALPNFTPTHLYCNIAIYTQHYSPANIRLICILAGNIKTENYQSLVCSHILHWDIYFDINTYPFKDRILEGLVFSIKVHYEKERLYVVSLQHHSSKTGQLGGGCIFFICSHTNQQNCLTKVGSPLIHV